MLITYFGVCFVLAFSLYTVSVEHSSPCTKHAGKCVFGREVANYSTINHGGLPVVVKRYNPHAKSEVVVASTQLPTYKEPCVLSHMETHRAVRTADEAMDRSCLHNGERYDVSQTRLTCLIVRGVTDPKELRSFQPDRSKARQGLAKGV